MSCYKSKNQSTVFYIIESRIERNQITFWQFLLKFCARILSHINVFSICGAVNVFATIWYIIEININGNGKRNGNFSLYIRDLYFIRMNKWVVNSGCRPMGFQIWQLREKIIKSYIWVPIERDVFVKYSVGNKDQNCLNQCRWPFI